MAAETPYCRVDLHHLPPDTRDGAATGPLTTHEPVVPQDRVRLWIVPLSIFLCCLQAGLTIIAENVFFVIITSTLIPVAGFALLFGLVLILNPVIGFLGRCRSRRLNRIELVCLFTAMLVTAGISTFGLASHLVPMIPAPWNPEWNTAQRGWDETLTHPEHPALNPMLYLQEDDAIRSFREGVSVRSPAEGASVPERLRYYGAVFRAIPWAHWIPPVGYWLLFTFGCYGIFYSLSYLVLRHWSDREKLTFPLAQLPLAVIPDDHDPRAFPAIFYRPGFWAGFAISALVLSWNGSIAAGWMIPDFRINLGLGRPEFERMADGTLLEGLGGSFRALIIFTAIGIAFLLPTQISFSTWSYFLFGQFLMLVAIWIGIGQAWGDFPSDFRSATNFLTAQGGGALLTFAAISLFRCLLEYATLARGRSIEERFRLTAPVVWLAISTTIVVLWLMWNRIPLVWAMGFVLVITLLTIGVMRIVAETSMYWFLGNFGFFHAFNILGLGKLVPGALLAPLMPIYSIFFMDLKTFIAPNILNAAKMQADTGRGRRMFHINLIICLVASVVFAVGFMIFIAHARGGQQMHGWFFNSMPLGTLDSTLAFVRDTDSALSFNTLWFFIGAGWLGFSLWIRRTLFWFPHPIGYILLFNPLMANLWLSFFIGWMAKKVTVTYGGKSTFDRVRPIFIGLIIGELLAIFIWMLLGLTMGFHSGLDLNRQTP